jgi:hypothetical protein
LPDIVSAVTLNGPGAKLLTVRRNAAEEFRLFTIGLGLQQAAIAGMTLSNGRSLSGGGVDSASPLTIVQSVLSNNSASSGGAIFVGLGGARIVASTITNNSAESGGGLYVFGAGDGHPTQIDQTTISGNQASDAGGALMNVAVNTFRSTVAISQSTISNNISNAAAGNVVSFAQDSGSTAIITFRNSLFANIGPSLEFQSVVQPGGFASNLSRGFNVVAGGFTDVFGVQPSDQFNANAGLAALADNGGPTPTHALLIGSDALDAGSAEGSSWLRDQRGTGFSRTVDLPMISNMIGGDGTDVGAHEAQSSPAPGSDEIFGNGFE